MRAIALLLCILKFVYSLIPTTKVEQGELFGKKYTLSNKRVVNAFLGIPYAAPPVTNYRFQSPQKVEPWEGAYNASFHRSDCLQTKMFDPNNSITGDEDCLYLNIYTPKLPNGDKHSLLNVFVYIHGGAFTFGTGNVLPDRFLENKNIVFVSMNYRLGLFGFLSMNDTEAPGNYGLKDQSAALKWIKKNIHNFGGNPDSITIAGVSAGGASVDFHMLHSKDEDLFHKALSFSGSCLVSWAICRNADEKSKNLSTAVGCSFDNTADVIKCLRKKSASDLLGAQTKVPITELHPIVFGPVIEVPNSNAFLTTEPMKLLKNARVKDIPWIASTVKDEGLYSVAKHIKSDAYFNEIDTQWEEIAPFIFDYDHTLNEVEKEIFSSTIKEFYFGEKKISRETWKEFVQVMTEGKFLNGILYSSLFHSAAIKSNVYFLLFSYRGERSWTNIFANDTENYGVCHGDDMQYFIKQSPSDELKNQSDIAVSKLMTSIIVNFMETGNPNKAVPQWEPITRSLDFDAEVKYLNIYSAYDGRIETLLMSSTKRQLWNTIFFQQKYYDFTKF